MTPVGHADEVVLGPLGEPGEVAGGTGPGRAGRPGPRRRAHSSAADDDRPAPVRDVAVDADVEPPATGRARPRAAPRRRRPRRRPSRRPAPGARSASAAVDGAVALGGARPAARRSPASRPAAATPCSQRERQHEPVVVVGVLADQVDPPGRPQTPSGGAVARRSLTARVGRTRSARPDRTPTRRRPSRRGRGLGRPAELGRGPRAGGDQHGRVARRGAGASCTAPGGRSPARTASTTSRTEKPVPLPRL